MTLNWIATRTQEAGAFHPDGIGRPTPVRPVDTELLTQGSILMEATVRPQVRPVNLVRFAALSPWPSGLTICLEPDGTVRLLMRQGTRQLATALKTTLGSTVQTAHITFIWDAPRRLGRLGVHVPDHGLMWQTDVIAPFPLALSDAQRIVRDTKAATLDPSVSFLAIADAPCPLGPIPGLLGWAAVDTPDGPRPIREMRAGDLVSVADSAPVPVLWAGQATVPALGRFAPMTLRRPYMGLWDDLIAAKDQRVCLAGSEVEYLFGEERVSTAVRHLEARNCATPSRPVPATITYHQILLETHEIITVNGALVESFDGSAVLDQPDCIATSVMADMPADRRPRQVGLAAPVLQGYEALTLTGVLIG